jgi:hypothetical protein
MFASPHPFTSLEKHQKQAEQHQDKVMSKISAEEHKKMIKLVKPVPYYHSIIPPEMMSVQSPPQPTRAWKLTVEHRKKLEEENRIRLAQEKAEDEERREKLKVCIYLAYGIDLLISIEQHNQTPCQATRN